MSVVIDGALVGSPAGWTSRCDLSSLFPGGAYSGVATALGVYTFDPSQLANGLHTISWAVTDSAGNADGIGSLYFTVTGGTAAPGQSAARGAIAGADMERRGQAVTVPRQGGPGPALRSIPYLGRRGFNFEMPLRALVVDDTGRAVVEGEELDRFELRPTDDVTGLYTAHLRSGDTLVPLPAGSRFDAATGALTWQPGVGFVGTYDLVFGQWSRDRAIGQTDVRIVLHPRKSNRVGPQVIVDTPAPGSRLSGGMVVAGWAIDLDDAAGPGVDAVHVWAYPASGGEPLFLGAAETGGMRPDVAALFGERFGRSGYGVGVAGLPPGTWDLAVFAWSTVRGRFVPATVVRVTAR